MRERDRWCFLATALLGLLPVVAGQVPSWSQETSPTPKRRVVPDVRGRSLAVARQLLRLSDLQDAHGVFYIAAHNWRDDILPGVVYLQTPASKSVVRDGDAVACWTFEKASSEQRTVCTPDLIGKSLLEAVQALTDAGLKTANPDARPTSDGANALHVRDQYPAPGQTVFEGVSVFLQLRGD